MIVVRRVGTRKGEPGRGIMLEVRGVGTSARCVGFFLA